MFFLVSVLVLTNIYIIPYYFTSQFEYFIIEFAIPFLNNIYLNKNQKRIIEVRIFTETETEPININILHDEVNNFENDNSTESSCQLVEKILDNEIYDKLEDNDKEEDNATEDNATEDNAKEDNAIEDNATEDNAKEDNSTEDNATKDDTEDTDTEDEYDKIFKTNIIKDIHDKICNIVSGNVNSENNNEVDSDSIFVENVQ